MPVLAQVAGVAVQESYDIYNGNECRKVGKVKVKCGNVEQILEADIDSQGCSEANDIKYLYFKNRQVASCNKVDVWSEPYKSDGHFRVSALVYDGASPTFEDGDDALDEIKIFGAKRASAGEDDLDNTDAAANSGGDDDYTEEGSDYGASVVPNQEQERVSDSKNGNYKHEFVKTSDRLRSGEELKRKNSKIKGDPNKASRGVDPERLMNGEGDLATIVHIRLMYDALKYNFIIDRGTSKDR